ncbi:MAG: polyprenyl synthetase family protein [Gammaproteobacteria bacterium]
MDPKARIENALTSALRVANHDDCPPMLTRALSYAVFPGGARVRPRLTMSVALACGATDYALVDASAASLELLHCASLVHDDLPCFDDADMRRGKPSIHVAFDERIAVLCGDALIVTAFQNIANGAANSPAALPSVINILGRAVSVPTGIVAGQAWECEPDVKLERYQRQKTGALFVAATQLGAASAGADPLPWAQLGQGIGEAYQVADDILDVTANPEEIGKPVGRDAARLNPNSVLELGMDASIDRLRNLVTAAADSIPDCPGHKQLHALITAEASAMMEAALMCSAAA